MGKSKSKRCVRDNALRGYATTSLPRSSRTGDDEPKPPGWVSVQLARKKDTIHVRVPEQMEHASAAGLVYTWMTLKEPLVSYKRMNSHAV